MSTLNLLLQLAAVVAQEVEEDEQLRCEEVNSDVESKEEEDSHILESLKPLNTIDTNKTVLLFNNFNFDELMQLWVITADVMIESWGGRGRQANIGPFKAFYLLLYHYKRGKEPDAMGSWIGNLCKTMEEKQWAGSTHDYWQQLVDKGYQGANSLPNIYMALPCSQQLLCNPGTEC